MILAIDTATRWLGVALLDHKQQQIIWSFGQIAQNTQTVTCAAIIADGLGATGATPADLSGIAVAIGPGSYTGLRIGLGVAKGLALPHNTPILPVPTFDIWATALPAHEQPLIITAAAGRQRVIAAPHAWAPADGRWQPSAEPDILSWSDLLDQISTPWLVAGEIPPNARRRLDDHPLAHPLSPAWCVRQPAVLAELGAGLLARGETAAAATVAPRYLRNPQGS